MKKSIFIISGCLFFFIQSFSQGTWTQKANFGGSARTGAIGFSIGDKGYIGTGVNGTNPYLVLHKDFWEWNSVTSAWTQKADFGGGVRCNAVGFSVGTKGYIGTGTYDFPPYSPQLKSNDFWEYDPSTNIWIQKTNFPGSARDFAVGFSIGNKGYIGTGNLNNDFWEWDQTTDTWTQRANLLVRKDAATGFSIGNKGYIGLGDNPQGPTQDFWEWDQFTDTWIQRQNFPGSPRDCASGFSIGNKGYIGTGGFYTTDFWEWDQFTNTWTQQTSFSGTLRVAATGFSIGTKGYLGTGYNYVGPYKRDFWEFNPLETSSIRETESVIDLSVYPNPGSIFTVSVTFSGPSGPFDLKISNEEGKTVYSEKIKETSSSVSKQIDLSTLPNGIYFVELKCGKQRSVKKIVVQ